MNPGRGRPPELQAIIDEIGRGPPFASVEEVNRVLADRMREYNASPQSALGGLSPDEMGQLLYGDWMSHQRRRRLRYRRRHRYRACHAAPEYRGRSVTLIAAAAVGCGLAVAGTKEGSTDWCSPLCSNHTVKSGRRALVYSTDVALPTSLEGRRQPRTDPVRGAESQRLLSRDCHRSERDAAGCRGNRPARNS